MTADISKTKQTFFKPVTIKNEIHTVINSLFKTHKELQVKQDGASADSIKDLTLIMPENFENDVISGKYVSGPRLPIQDNLTIVFEVGSSMYFCKGRILKAQIQEYQIQIRKLFELQRRDSYRVIIAPALIKASFIVRKIDGAIVEKEFRVVDLSTGGLGIAFEDESKSLISAGAEIHGDLTVSNHTVTELQALVKYLRPSNSARPPYTHAGCEFQKLTTSLAQKIGFIVNDCHRISFSRITK